MQTYLAHYLAFFIELTLDMFVCKVVPADTDGLCLHKTSDCVWFQMALPT